jgi:hypothetical protein
MFRLIHSNYTGMPSLSICGLRLPLSSDDFVLPVFTLLFSVVWAALLIIGIQVLFRQTYRQTERLTQADTCIHICSGRHYLVFSYIPASAECARFSFLFIDVALVASNKVHKRTSCHLHQAICGSHLAVTLTMARVSSRGSVFRPL